MPRRFVRQLVDRLIHPKYLVVLDYPIKPYPRYGEGKPPHQRLADLLARNDASYRELLDKLIEFRPMLSRIAEAEARPEEPHWDNAFFSAMDAIGLYGMIGHRKPSRYLEVGSGNSTKFARRAARDLGLSLHITSIDPFPRADIDLLCDRVIRKPMEDVDPKIFDELASGDMLFVDNSHRVFMNSDATVFFLEILPRLKPGIIVHVHDIFLPFDYPNRWIQRHYSEQYLLAAYLLAEYAKIRVLLPLAYVSCHPELRRKIDEGWSDPIFQRAFDRYKGSTGSYIATSFWLETV